MAAFRSQLLALCMATAVAGAAYADSQQQSAALASDTPAKFATKKDAFDFVKREEMIPMRDGVKLKTFILIPKGAKNAPILLTRTPYNARFPKLN